MGGIQSGKSTMGALRMGLSVLKHKEPENTFIIAADTYKTLSQATIPRFQKMWGHLGKLAMHSGEFKTHWGSTIYLRTGTEPDSIEGITDVRHIWLDEGGKVSNYFFENLMGRAAFRQCPIDVTTTPYVANWLTTTVLASRDAKRDDASYIICKSIDNPYFPEEEYKRQRSILDPRRFKMKYDGEPGQIEGLVYDKLNLCKSFALPSGTRYFGGVDWGYHPDPFCFVLRAVTPDGRHYRPFEYYKTYLTISDIVRLLQSFKSVYNFEMLFCDPSQPALIEELNRNQLRAVGANNDIRLGIDKHYELIKNDKFFIFEEFNPIGVGEYRAYHYPEPRELKIDEGRAKKDVVPVDKDNHGTDCDRYITLALSEMIGKIGVSVIEEAANERPVDIDKRILWLKRGGTREEVVY